MITKTLHGTTKDGKTANLYTLTSGSFSATISTFGGILISFEGPDRNGDIANVVLSCKTIGEYEDNATYFGAIIGRVANRISNAQFTLDGKEYSLDKNDHDMQTLHGGFNGFNKRIFNANVDDNAKDPTLYLSLESKEGDMGFPGKMNVSVTYSLSSKGDLTISYKADVDKRTPINLTNHAYFNLKGKGDILNHQLFLNCDRYLRVNEHLIPTGEIASVTDTSFDFTTAKPIIKDINGCGGYDHCMIAKEGSEITTPIAVVKERESGRVMKVYTSMEAVQFYSGNFLDGSVKNPLGVPYEKHGGFCLETQHYPDAVNQPNFPSTIYDKDNSFVHTTIYSLSNED